jgi:mRNA interferase HigB
VRIISRRALLAFAKIHADAGRPLDAWYRIAKAARWSNLGDVRATWPSADVVGGLTIFNVKGNSYRLIARIDYRTRIVYVRSVLTHAEYDRGDWREDR